MNKHIKMMMKLMLPAMMVLLSGCGNDTIDKIIDASDKPRSAKISYINATDQEMDFHLKSPVYNSGVYETKHFVASVLSHEVSTAKSHNWVDFSNKDKAEFAITDTNSKTIKIKSNFELVDNKEYWSVAWLNNSTYQQTNFAKQRKDEVEKYTIRVFANEALALQRLDESVVFNTTEAGIVSDSFTIDNCNDLLVGGNQIDICATAEVLSSYLLVVNKQGFIVVVRE